MQPMRSLVAFFDDVIMTGVCTVSYLSHSLVVQVMTAYSLHSIQWAVRAVEGDSPTMKHDRHTLVTLLTKSHHTATASTGRGCICLYWVMPTSGWQHHEFNMVLHLAAAGWSKTADKTDETVDTDRRRWRPNGQTDIAQYQYHRQQVT